MAIYNRIRNNIDFFASLNLDIPQREIDFFEANSNIVQIKRGEYFFIPNNTCKHLGIIKNGLLRSYISVDGQEYNIEFYRENELVSAFTSFLTQAPSDWTIQALEDCEITSISIDLLNELYKRHNCWTEFGKKIFEQQTIKKCRREKSLIGYDALKRYTLFRQEYHSIENRIPLFHIAAYLGIQAETLSRIRNKISLNHIS